MSTQYRLLYGGQWLPIEHLLRGEHRVHHPERASAAVCKLPSGEWLAIEVGPGDVFTEWHPFRPPESAWERID